MLRLGLGMTDKKRVLVLGVTGMLGSMMDQVLRSTTRYDVLGTARQTETGRASGPPSPAYYVLDAERDDTATLERIVEDVHPAFIVNCIGIIKPYCRDDDPTGIRRAIVVNALFPYRLAESAQRVGARVIQIATDCVYSGRTGNYDERAPHDPLDVYGKTKSLGEVRAANVLHVRTSIIGPERSRSASLFEWFMSHSKGATVPGFDDHRWNGVTTLQFAELCHRIIDQGAKYFDALVATAPVHHVVLNGTVTKYELLQAFAKVFEKQIHIERVASGAPVDRTLSTAFHELPIPKDPQPMEEALRALRDYIEDAPSGVRAPHPLLKTKSFS